MNRVKNKLNQLFFLGFLIYLCSYLIFYPSFFSIADESAYLSTSNHLLNGQILIEDPLDSHNLVYSPSRASFVPGFQLGNSIIILPSVLFGWKFVFLTGLLLHLLNSYVFAKILKQYNLNKIYTLFYLLYPGLIFYSRTIMTEISTITFTLLGFYYYIKTPKPNYFLAGFLWGISCLIRPTNALIIIPIIAFCIFKLIINLIQINLFKQTDLKNLINLILGIFPSFILAIFFNYFIYGGLFDSRHGGGSTGIYNELFSFTFSQLFVYWKPILILSLIYPLMLYIPFIMKYKKKSEISLIILLFLFVLGKSDIIRYTWLINLAIGHRYFFPIIPLMLIPYSLYLEQFFKKFVPLILIVLIIFCPILMYKQNAYSQNNFEIMGQIYNIIPSGSIVVTTTDSQYFNSFFGDLKPIKLSLFETLNYTGDYYLFYYHNEELFKNLRKKFSIDDVASRNDIVKHFVEKENLDLIYDKNGLLIYQNI